ncbi:ABC transporter ATP-binding protein [Candidatus Saccharibacteria bacterium]|nr:ABC transporter ATP-binding protein [Candidatus Saccharibacteria bacterium]
MKHVWRIIKSTRQLWRYYAIVSFFTVLLSVFTLSQPILTGWVIDEIRKGDGVRFGYVVWIAIAVFVVDLLYTLLSNFSGYYGDQIMIRLQKILSDRYYTHLMSLPQRYFDTELSGKIINRLNRSIGQITSFMQIMSNSFLQFIFGTIFALIAVAWYSIEVAGILFLLYPIYTWMTFRSSATWQKYQDTKNLHTDIASGRFAESINQLKVVKSFIAEKRELRYFSGHLEKVVQTNKPQSKFWHTRDVQRRLVLNIIFFAVFLYVVVQSANQVFTPGQAVSLILLSMQIRIPIFTISYIVESTQRAIADSRDYFNVMDQRPEITDHKNAKQLKVVEGRIEFDSVWFSYDENQSIIRDASLIVSPGNKVALVGESGEGKTTLTSLLMRLYEPEKGCIKIDDQDISLVTQQSLRKNIGVVFQESMLFSGTLRENIAYSYPNAPLERVIEAARAANAHEFISKLEDGYDTQIGERGLKLSGGQKQRVAIARALLKDAPILILDEATSSLDGRSETMVQEALERLMVGRTTLIIAHRLSTIQGVDQIVTLRNGTVDEIGSPAKLAKTGGIYNQLLDLQYRNKPTEQSKKKLEKYDISG